MAIVRIALNRRGVGALLKGRDMQLLMRSHAGEVKRRAGDGFEARTGVGRRRARAAVITATPEAREAEAKHRRLSSALGAGRG